MFKSEKKSLHFHILIYLFLKVTSTSLFFFMPVLMAYYETEAKIETSVALTLRYDICDI